MEPPSPPAEDVRSGVLFEDASDNEGPSTMDRRPNLSCVDVFPVNKPPRRKRNSVDVPAAGAGMAGTGAASKRRVAVAGRTSVEATKHTADDSAVAGASSSHPPAGVSGMAVNPCQIEAPTIPDSNDLLDDRKVADIDELYGENERALSNFMKLHPMLS